MHIKSFLNYFIVVFIATVISGCAVSNYDEDFDGVQNSKDVCLGTPKTAKVDKYGCALDSDHDGVIDIYDKCPNTGFLDLVNYAGCKKDI